MRDACLSNPRLADATYGEPINTLGPYYLGAVMVVAIAALLPIRFHLNSEGRERESIHGIEGLPLPLLARIHWVQWHQESQRFTFSAPQEVLDPWQCHHQSEYRLQDSAAQHDLPFWYPSPFVITPTLFFFSVFFPIFNDESFQFSQPFLGGCW